MKRRLAEIALTLAVCGLLGQRQATIRAIQFTQIGPDNLQSYLSLVPQPDGRWRAEYLLDVAEWVGNDFNAEPHHISLVSAPRVQRLWAEVHQTGYPYYRDDNTCSDDCSYELKIDTNRDPEFFRCKFGHTQAQEKTFQVIRSFLKELSAPGA